MYPPITPILIRIGPLSLHWYGLIMTLAIFLGALVASRFVSRHDGDGNVIWDMLLWVLIPALIGARLYYVFIQSPRGPNGINQYLTNPVEILQIWRGGIHIYGGLIFGGIALLLYLRRAKLPLARYLDGVALGLALGQTIGRLGNFVNQELYGPPATLPWGLHIDADHRIPPYDDLVRYPDSTRFHPLFLYEMVWDAIGFVLLLWISRRLAKHLRIGDIFLLYLVWVPGGRFFLEFLRTDSWFFPGTPFNTAHILTAMAVVCGAVFLFVRHRYVPAIEQAVESQNDQRNSEVSIAAQDVQEDVEKPVDTQDGQETAEMRAEAQDGMEKPVDIQDSQETAEMRAEAQDGLETSVDIQDGQETAEMRAEAQDSVEALVDTQDSQETAEMRAEAQNGTETLVEAQDGQEKVETRTEAQNGTGTLVEAQDGQEKVETRTEAQNGTGTPVEAQDGQEITAGRVEEKKPA